MLMMKTQKLIWRDYFVFLYNFTFVLWSLFSVFSVISLLVFFSCCCFVCSWQQTTWKDRGRHLDMQPARQPSKYTYLYIHILLWICMHNNDTENGTPYCWQVWVWKTSFIINVNMSWVIGNVLFIYKVVQISFKGPEKWLRKFFDFI